MDGTSGVGHVDGFVFNCVIDDIVGGAYDDVGGDDGGQYHYCGLEWDEKLERYEKTIY